MTGWTDKQTIPGQHLKWCIGQGLLRVQRGFCSLHPSSLVWHFVGTFYCLQACAMLLLSCSGYLCCQIKASGPASWRTYQSSSHAIKVRDILPRCFMCNCRKIALVESSQKEKKTLLLLASVWEIWRQTQGHKKFCERACKAWWEAPGAGTAEQQTCPPIHPPPLPTSWLLLQDRHSPKHPSSAFHTPIWSKQTREESQFWGSHSLSGRNSGTDKQPGDNPTEFCLSSSVPLSVCSSVHTGKEAIPAAF